MRTSIWAPTARTMGRMTMAPTVWLMNVVATSTSAQNIANTCSTCDTVLNYNVPCRLTI